MTSITQVQGGLLIALAQTHKRLGRGLDLKGNAFYQSASPWIELDLHYEVHDLFEVESGKQAVLR
jgi:hypothetical protein